MRWLSCGQAQAHAAQAAAARQAAEQLHAAFTQARGRIWLPVRGGDQVAGPGPAARAEAEFPVPVAEVVAEAGCRTAACCSGFPAARGAAAGPGQADTLMPRLPRTGRWWLVDGMGRGLAFGRKGSCDQGSGAKAWRQAVLGGGGRGGVC